MSPAEVLLFDDFDNNSLNTQVWNQGSWHLGRTQLGNQPSFDNDGETSYLSLKLDSYNPNEPGQTLYGSEIYSLDKFDVGTGLEIEARLRASAMPAGLIASLFAYAQDQQGFADEIDIEILTAQPNNTFLATSWNDWGHPDSNYGDGIHHAGSLLSLADYDYQNWQTYSIRWYPERIEWYLNGKLVKQQNNPVPNLALSIRSNFWAANNDWQNAYSADLAATPDFANNQQFHYDIDYIKVSRISDNSTSSPLAPLEISRDIISRWNTGYCENVRIHNPDSRTRDWSIELIINGTLSHAWNAQVSMLEEGLLNAQNSTLAGNATTSFGYCINSPKRAMSNSDLIITRKVTTDWGTGYCEDIQITNPNDAIGIWQISLPITGSLKNHWSSNMSQTDNQIQVSGVNWNEKLNPLASTTVGYCANK
jgi:hypothetical protein